MNIVIDITMTVNAHLRTSSLGREVYPMQVLTNALRVLECVILSQPVGVSEVARRLKLPKSSVQRSLTSLEQEGWLERDNDQSGLWVQTSRIWILAHQGREIGIRSLAQEPMRWLWEQTNESIHFTQQQGDDLVVVDKIESTHPVRVFDPIGTRIPLHVSASGKALLASRDDAGIEAYLRRSLTRFTHESLTDAEALRHEMIRVQADGYSVNRGEWRSEIGGVGIALNLDANHEAEFGLAISAPTHRMGGDKVSRYGELLLEAKDRVARAAALTSQAERESTRPARLPSKLRTPRLGLIVPPAGDQVPPEARTLFPDGIDFVARGLGITTMTPAGFDDGLERLEAAVSDLLVEGVSAISVMGTSLTFYNGDQGNEEVLRRVREASGGLPATTMAKSIVESLKNLGARRVSVVAAYTADMTQRLVRYLEDNGLEVVSQANLGIESIEKVRDVTDDVLEAAVQRALKAIGSRHAPDAILISCGGLKSKDVSNRIQQRTSIPVVSSSVDGLRHAVALLK